MKHLLHLTATASILGLVSCQPVQQNPYTASAQPNSPYAAPQAQNPYAVPQAPQAAPNPYAAPNLPANDPAPNVGYTPLPSPPASSQPTYTPAPASTPSPAGSHTVSKGDTLWGLSRKYGTSVDALKAANGLSSNTIVVGQTLNIPN